MEYIVKKYIECTIDIKVKADSFAEAFAKADSVDYDLNDATVLGDAMYDATREDGEYTEYMNRPYPDKKEDE